jgi:hypothetical protein
MLLRCLQIYMCHALPVIFFNVWSNANKCYVKLSIQLWYCVIQLYITPLCIGQQSNNWIKELPMMIFDMTRRDFIQLHAALEQ